MTERTIEFPDKDAAILFYLYLRMLLNSRSEALGGGHLDFNAEDGEYNVIADSDELYGKVLKAFKSSEEQGLFTKHESWGKVAWNG